MTVVLIAEDEVDIRDLLTMALSMHRIDVIEAFDGLDAIEKTRRHRPDILLLDIIMPHRSGFEVCEELQQDDELKNIPVIFVSAKIDQEELMKSRALGVETVIEKPFDFSLLVSKINDMAIDSNKGRCV